MTKKAVKCSANPGGQSKGMQLGDRGFFCPRDDLGRPGRRTPGQGSPGGAGPRAQGLSKPQEPLSDPHTNDHI